MPGTVLARGGEQRAPLERPRRVVHPGRGEPVGPRDGPRRGLGARRPAAGRCRPDGGPGCAGGSPRSSGSPPRRPRLDQAERPRRPGCRPCRSSPYITNNTHVIGPGIVAEERAIWRVLVARSLAPFVVKVTVVSDGVTKTPDGRLARLAWVWFVYGMDWTGGGRAVVREVQASARALGAAAFDGDPRVDARHADRILSAVGTFRRAADGCHVHGPAVPRPLPGRASGHRRRARRSPPRATCGTLRSCVAGDLVEQRVRGTRSAPAAQRAAGAAPARPAGRPHRRVLGELPRRPGRVRRRDQGPAAEPAVRRREPGTGVAREPARPRDRADVRRRPEPAHDAAVALDPPAVRRPRRRSS